MPDQYSHIVGYPSPGYPYSTFYTSKNLASGRLLPIKPSKNPATNVKPVTGAQIEANGKILRKGKFAIIYKDTRL